MANALGSVGGCLLFAVAFGGVGVFTGWLTGATVYDGWRARDWTPVPAEATADEGFRYEWKGRTYTSWRLTPLAVGESDVDGSDKVLERLAQARNNGKPITVYVNPNDPEEAMADRSVPWMFVVAMTPFEYRCSNSRSMRGLK